MNNILDRCIFIKCPLKDSCLRYGRKLREGQVTIFRYNLVKGIPNKGLISYYKFDSNTLDELSNKAKKYGCKNYFNKRHYAKQEIWN